MSTLSRRTLLAGLVGGSALAAGSGVLLHHLWQSLNAHEGIYVNFVGPQGYKGNFRPDLEDKFKMVIWNIHTGALEEIPVPFHVHSVVFSPKTSTFLGIQKWRDQMFSLDWKSRKINKVLKNTKHRQFIGHGVMHPEHKQIYVSEGLFPRTTVNYAEGKITLRDIHTLKWIEEFPSHGENPHDIRLLQRGEVLVVCNQGTINQRPETRSNIAFIQRRTGKLLTKIQAPSLQQNFAHMDLLSDTEVLAVTKSRQKSSNNFIVKASVNGKMELFDNGNLKGKTVDEILSVAVDQKRRIVAATNPKGQRVLFWDINTRKLIKSINTFEKPLGISMTKDGRFYIVSDIRQGTALLNADTLQLENHFLPKNLQQRHFTLAHSTMLTAS